MVLISFLKLNCCYHLRCTSKCILNNRGKENPERTFWDHQVIAFFFFLIFILQTPDEQNQLSRASLLSVQHHLTTMSRSDIFSLFDIFTSL